MTQRNHLLTMLALAMAMLLSPAAARAAGDDVEYGLLNHLGVGLSVGTDGVGLDVAAPLCEYVALRGGVSFWPKIKYERNFEFNANDPVLDDNVDVEAKLNIFDAKLLADFYPFRGCSFHVTAGAFIGSSKVVQAQNTSMFIKDPAKYGKMGLVLGDYRITTDRQGYAHADVKVNAVKPYIGIGFGRAVPRKGRIGVACDIGVKFWGKPGLGAMTKNDWDVEQYHKFSYKDLTDDDDEDLRDGLEIAEKIIVFPVINIRIGGRIF